MIRQDYNIAISETLEILNHTRQEDVDKIPVKFLKFLKDNALVTYKPSLDFNKPLNEMNLNEKTIGLLSIINRKYWCDDNQKKEFDNKLKENETIFQQRLQIKYNTDNLFNNRKIDINSNNDIKTKETAIIEYKQKSFLEKILDKIKKLFNRK